MPLGQFEVRVEPKVPNAAPLTHVGYWCGRSHSLLRSDTLLE